jgi:hypothetical protein
MQTLRISFSLIAVGLLALLTGCGSYVYSDRIQHVAIPDGVTLQETKQVIVSTIDPAYTLEGTDAANVSDESKTVGTANNIAASRHWKVSAETPKSLIVALPHGVQMEYVIVIEGRAIRHIRHSFVDARIRKDIYNHIRTVDAQIAKTLRKLKVLQDKKRSQPDEKTEK